jgi:hypothetical protein
MVRNRRHYIIIIHILISNNLIVAGSVDIQTSLSIPNIGNVETALDGKQDLISDGDLSITKTDGLQTALTELDELTSSHITQISSNDTDITALQGNLDTEEPKTSALKTLTATHTTDIASNTANILTEQPLITSFTDLECNSITTQETLTSKICGYSFTKEATVSRMLGGTQSLTAFNSASGNTTYDCGGVLFFAVKGNARGRLTNIGLKLGPNASEPTEVLDVAGNILASGSLTASSVIVNSTNLITELSSLVARLDTEEPKQLPYNH